MNNIELNEESKIEDLIKSVNNIDLNKDDKDNDNEKKEEKKDNLTKIINKGTGAGGANTNLNGKKFEDKTCNEQFLINNEYIKINYDNKNKNTNKNNKFNYYLLKTYSDRKVYFFKQSSLKIYLKENYDIELFRHPDEAYIIEYNNGIKILKILEKKEQNVEGSVIDKLWTGPTFKDEYQFIVDNNFKVEYSYCLNKFLWEKINSENKKFKILKDILKKYDIKIFYGNKINDLEELNNWILE